MNEKVISGGHAGMLQQRMALEAEVVFRWFRPCPLKPCPLEATAKGSSRARIKVVSTLPIKLQFAIVENGIISSLTLLHATVIRGFGTVWVHCRSGRY